MSHVDNNNEQANETDQTNNKRNTYSPPRKTIKKSLPTKKKTPSTIGKGNIPVRTVEQDMMANPEYYDDLEDNSDNDDSLVDDVEPNGPPMGTGVTSI